MASHLNYAIIPSFVDVSPTEPDLSLLLARLRNRVTALQRSNDELVAALATGEDADFREALLENGPVLERTLKHVAELEALLAQIERARVLGQSLHFMSEEEAVESGLMPTAAPTSGLPESKDDQGMFL